MWHICLTVSFAIILLTLIVLIVTTCRKKGAYISPANVLTIGIFIASVVMFIPISLETFATDGITAKIFKTAFISVLHTLKIFLVDNDFEVIRSITSEKQGLFYNIYSSYAAALFLIAPLLTFSVVLSFFKNAAAYRQYLKSYNKNIYVFSKLNDKSLALAQSIHENYKSAKIIFIGVQEQNEDEDNLAKARSLKAICFKKDMLSINFNFHSRDKDIAFFTIDDNEAENVKLALSIISKYKNRAKTRLYVSSNETEGEVLLSSVETNLLKVRRISDVRTLIYSLLESTGELLFKEAVDYPENNKKLISAVVVGLGKHGTEMTKSLAWFGQMDGYRTEITSFDKKTDAKDKFTYLCPELMSEKFNNQFTDDGEAQYKIDIRGGIDVETMEFLDEINSIPEITYIFVDIGNDENNIRTAIKLRTLLLKKDKAPRIQAVVSNSEKKAALEGITNHSGQKYNIDFVGDIRSFYSVGSIIDSDLETEALARHMKWGKEEDFWKYEYNHRSSVASALHRRMKVICETPGINKEPSQRTEEERLKLRMVEHRRWNAYMRSEGFTFAEKRNNLAKTHHCLITYNDLTPEEKAKDDD